MAYSYIKKEIPQELLEADSLKHLHPVALEVLLNRGLSNEKDVLKHLYSTLDDVLTSKPMKDTDLAVARLKKAVEEGEAIVVYRDYDCDGCCSGAIAVECLQNLGAKVTHYSNDRVKDGYGMCNQGIDNILQREPEAKLIVTVDNGIAALEQIDYAVSRGLEVVVTDHHTPGEKLPNALAIVDPKQVDETADFRDLCGAGVIFKVMIALYQEMGRDIAPVLNSLDLVALATVADVVPMRGENRVLVREGIKVMLDGRRVFFSELLRIKDMKNISAHGEIGFQIAPMVNAVSRMAYNTDLVVNAFLSNNREIVGERVLDLLDLNQQRKDLTRKAVLDMEDQVKKSGLNLAEEDGILLITPNVSSGLVGIVAGQFSEKFNKVAGIFHETPEGVLKGSMRGIDGFHIKLALDEISPELLIAHGGHAKAAGLTMLPEDFPQFVTEFKALLKKAFPDGPVEGMRPIDIVLQEEECTVEMVKALSALEPFGEEFLAPLFGVTAQAKSHQLMGKDRNHIKFKAQQTEFIRWHCGEDAEEKARQRLPKKFIGAPSLNEFRGNTTVQFICEFYQ